MPHSKLTIMIVPHSHKRVREITVSQRTIWVAAGALVIAVVLSLTYAIGFHVRYNHSVQLSRSRMENSALSERIRDISGGMATLKTKLNQLERKEHLLRVLAKLPQVDDETRMMGVGDFEGDGGGPEVITKATKLGFAVQADIDGLVRQGNWLYQSFERIEASLSDDIETQEAMPSVWPVSRLQVYRSSGFGYRLDPFTRRRRVHKGLDLAGPAGTPVMATGNGVVVRATRGRYIGKGIRIDHGNGYLTQYGHLLRMFVRAGQKVTRGQVIAEIGNTGRSTGPHLHYGVFYRGKALDPENFLLAEE
jgi:murein DD-endopeptidase MepM/ murein hydrolase activator NlpD